MKFSEYENNAVFRVTAYDDSRIMINDQPYDSSLIVTRDKINPDWTPSCPEEINLEIIEQLFSYRPELIILGTGSKIVFPDQEAMARCAQEGIGLEIMDTASACRTYNVLLTEEREVVAGLLLPGV